MTDFRALVDEATSEDRRSVEDRSEVEKMLGRLVIKLENAMIRSAGPTKSRDEIEIEGYVRPAEGGVGSKRIAIIRLFRNYPGVSDRAAAKAVGADLSYVRKIRAEMKKNGKPLSGQDGI